MGGCNSSKLNNEEAVQLCKERKKCIKQAIEHHIRFASANIAYIQSLKRVSAAIRDYVEGNEPHEILLDPYITRSLTPVKQSIPRCVMINPKCSIETPTIQSESKTSMSISYYRPSGNPAISVKESLQSPETVQIQSFSPLLNCEIDGFLKMQSPSLNPSHSPNDKAHIPPPPPQNNQWDCFWNPFSSLDSYEYHISSLDRSVNRLRELQEEGRPDLGEKTEDEELDTSRIYAREERNKSSINPREEITVEDVKDEDDIIGGDVSNHEVNGVQSQGKDGTELSQALQAQKSKVHHQETKVGDNGRREEMLGFTVHVNQRSTSIEEVIKDLETQFMVICDSVGKMSSLLECSQAKYLSTSHEISAMKMLNPAALFHPRSSHSSTFLVSSSGSGDERYEGKSDFSAESFTFSGSHKLTLDRLYAWEKRLYEDVRSRERTRQTYEKICKRLTNQDVKGKGSTVEKTRASLGHLYTKMQVAMHSIEAISMRIETLRDEELHPQLLELLQGLAKMWKTMAESHQMQKCTLDDAKLSLASWKLNKSRQQHSVTSATTIYPNRLAHSASNIENELRNWKACFESWIASQRSYVNCLANWLLRCMRCEPETSKLPFSPRYSMSSEAAPPIIGICLQWCRFINKVSEDLVVDGLNSCAAGIKSAYLQQMRVDSQKAQVSKGSERFGGNKDAVGYAGGEEEEAMADKKMKEVVMKVLCAGMSAAMSSLTDFAKSSAEGYAELVSHWENVNFVAPPSSGSVSC